MMMEIPQTEPSPSGTLPHSTSHHDKLSDFEQRYRLPTSDPQPNTIHILGSFIKNYFKNYSIRRSFLERFPFIDTLRTYRWKCKDDLIKDVISGVMVGVMTIPLGLAYASLSTLPHIIGLYMSFFASITYFIFGTSKHLSWGSVAIVSLMIANLLDMYDQSDEAIAFIKNLNLSQSTHDLDSLHNNNNILPSHLSQSNVQKGDRSGHIGFSNLDTQYDYGELTDAVLSIIKQENSTDKKNEILAAITDRRMEVASSVAVVTGVIFVLESMIGLDCLSALISSPLIGGFTVGVAFNIATSQLRPILGLSIKRFSGNFWIFRTWVAVVSHIEDTNIAVLVIFLICMLVLFVVKRFVNDRYKHCIKVLIPIELFVVIGAILASKFIHLHDEYDVRVLGEVPMGLPRPKFPDISLIFNMDYIVYGLVIAFVAHVQSLAMAKTLADGEDKRTVKPGQEMFAAGMSSLVCGLFSGFTPSANIPVSVAQRDSGGMSQISSLFSAGIVLLVIMLIGPYFHDLPDCVMSAIILVNIFPLFAKLQDVPNEWRKSKYDSLVWVFACLATIILDIGNALFISVCFSVLLVLLRTTINPVVEVIPIQTNPKGAMQIRPAEQYASAKTLLTVKLLKIRTPLYFFNSDAFVDAVFTKTNLNNFYFSATSKNSIACRREGGEVSVEKENTPLISSATNQKTLIHWKTLILDMSEVSFMDVMGVDALDHVIRVFGWADIRVMLVSIPDNLFGILRSTGFWKRHNDRLYIDVQSALDCMASIRDESHHNTPIPRNGLTPQIDRWV